MLRAAFDTLGVFFGFVVLLNFLLAIFLEIYLRLFSSVDFVGVFIKGFGDLIAFLWSEKRVPSTLYNFDDIEVIRIPFEVRVDCASSKRC